MSFRRPRSAAAPYLKPVNSRDHFKFVVNNSEPEDQCGAGLTKSSSPDTDDDEEYIRFHQNSPFPYEDPNWFRPQQRPPKFTTRNRRSSSPIGPVSPIDPVSPTGPVSLIGPVLTTVHAYAVSISTTGTVIVHRPSNRPSALGQWFWRLKARMTGKHNEPKKGHRSLFDLSEFNKKRMRRNSVATGTPNPSNAHVDGNSFRISSIRSALSTLSRKAKDAFPPITNRIQRRPGRPAEVLHARKESIATLLITPKTEQTTAVACDTPELSTMTRSGFHSAPERTIVTLFSSHRRNASDGTTVSSFLGSERSDGTNQSASTAPSSVLSTSAVAKAISAALGRGAEAQRPDRCGCPPLSQLRDEVSVPDPSADPDTMACTVARDMANHSHAGTSNTKHTNSTMTPPATAAPYVSHATQRLTSIGKSDAAPPSVTTTTTADDDTHVRTKPLGFKRTKYRPSVLREASISSMETSSSVGFDKPVSSHLPVSTPHARIASVSTELKSGSGMGGSIY
ncbi:hypothetical protein QBC39DRAFT_397936 [Podospora conica]|nr:hypothetical protein QBC39DRAFT_397936 [Schizothecium conicum]